jgi:Tfp pilus assembly protein PilN
MKPLNLATRPFRNEKLPQVLLGLASLLALAITALHARAIVRLLPGNTSKLAQEVTGLEEDGRRLRQEASRLRSTKPDPRDTARWSILKDLVDQRVFSWTRLLAVLEESLPKGVRLVSVSPKVRKGQFEIELATLARSSEDTRELLTMLEDRPEFEGTTPRRLTKTDDGIAFDVALRYLPTASPPPRPSPSPSPEAPAGEGAASVPGEQP